MGSLIDEDDTPLSPTPSLPLSLSHSTPPFASLNRKRKTWQEKKGDQSLRLFSQQREILCRKLTAAAAAKEKKKKAGKGEKNHVTQSMQSLATGNEDFPLLEVVDTGERKGRLLIVAWGVFFWK